MAARCVLLQGGAGNEAFRDQNTNVAVRDCAPRTCAADICVVVVVVTANIDSSICPAAGCENCPSIDRLQVGTAAGQ